MAVVRPQKKPEGVLQNVVTYFCFKANPISGRKLTKLVYLADVYHCELFGTRITQVPFRHYLYGAWAPEIEQSLEELYASEILVENVVPTKAGHRAIVPKAKVKQTTIHVAKSVFTVLERVIEDWGTASPDAVVEYSKKTLPFLNTPYSAVIDFCRTDPVVEYARQHSVSECEAATEDVLSNSSLVEAALQGDASIRRGDQLLTHQEVFGH
jgi:uncharacterized phage-associated protein